MITYLVVKQKESKKLVDIILIVNKTYSVTIFSQHSQSYFSAYLVSLSLKEFFPSWKLSFLSLYSK